MGNDYEGVKQACYMHIIHTAFDLSHPLCQIPTPKCVMMDQYRAYSVLEGVFCVLALWNDGLSLGESRCGDGSFIHMYIGVGASKYERDHASACVDL